MILALLILAAFFAVLSLAAWAADRQPPPPRPDRRLSAREMALTGDDYRDHVAAYFRKRSRQDAIVRNATEASWKS
jgi:hypothetical protein